jgi:hypothetical protein
MAYLVKIKRLTGIPAMLPDCVAHIATLLNGLLCLNYESEEGVFVMLTDIPTGIPPIRQRSLDIRASLL